MRDAFGGSEGGLEGIELFAKFADGLEEHGGIEEEGDHIGERDLLGNGPIGAEEEDEDFGEDGQDFDGGEVDGIEFNDFDIFLEVMVMDGFELADGMVLSIKDFDGGYS